MSHDYSDLPFFGNFVDFIVIYAYIVWIANVCDISSIQVVMITKKIKTNIASITSQCFLNGNVKIINEESANSNS